MVTGGPRGTVANTRVRFNVSSPVVVAAAVPSVVSRHIFPNALFVQLRGAKL